MNPYVGRSESFESNTDFQKQKSTPCPLIGIVNSLLKITQNAY